MASQFINVGMISGKTTVINLDAITRAEFYATKSPDGEVRHAIVHLIGAVPPLSIRDGFADHLLQALSQREWVPGEG